MILSPRGGTARASESLLRSPPGDPGADSRVGRIVGLGWRLRSLPSSWHPSSNSAPPASIRSLLPKLGLGGSYVPRASDPVCSLRSSGKMTGVMRDPRSRERRRRHRGYRPLRCDRLTRERGVASRGPEAIRPQWGMPERTGCRGATAPRRRRQGIRRPSGRDGDALKLVEARRSVVMKPLRPSPGR